MTNIEIIQAIRKEIISRIDKRHLSAQAQNELISILSFLSTLESEKPMNQEGLEEELDKWRHIHFDGERDGHFSGEYLERTSQLDLARHFAQWGAEHLKK